MIRLFISFIFVSSLTFGGFPQSYYRLDIKEQKAQFATTIARLTQNANQNTNQKRQFALNYLNFIYKQFFRDLDPQNLSRLLQIAKEYKIVNLFDENEYIKKLLNVPISLAIAQAAVESGWGKSRFAKEANNIFGHWTWGQKGLVPLNRDENKTHKIRIFNSLQDSVDAYVLNLNSHPAYASFRDARLENAKNGLKYGGLEAAQTMEKYSQMGRIYVKQLEKTINLYNLTKFDED